MGSNLKTLKELRAFDGEKESAEIPRDEPLPKKCTHKGIQMISGTELRCSCGIGYLGKGIQEIYDLLTK